MIHFTHLYDEVCAVWGYDPELLQAKKHFDSNEEYLDYVNAVEDEEDP